MMINAKTELYCIFGNPVRHSLSPLMHNAAFKETGRNAAYLAFEPDNIGEAVCAMKTLGISGASVTIPFKIDVIDYLDEIDELASSIGSVNTLVNINDKITGFNTDGIGAVEALKCAGNRIIDANVLILGNGGSSRAIAFTLQNEGAKVNIAGRNIKKVTDLCDDLNKHNAETTPFLISEIDEEMMNEFNIIINTTPIGMQPDVNSTPVELSLIPPSATVFDIIYSPHDTLLLQEARKKGCEIVYGIDMLLYQGVKQFELWTNQKAPVETMRTILQKNLK